jgi:hypothetical protein
MHLEGVGVQGDHQNRRGDHREGPRPGHHGQPNDVSEFGAICCRIGPRAKKRVEQRMVGKVGLF